MQNDQHICAKKLMKIASSGDCNRQMLGLYAIPLIDISVSLKGTSAFGADLALSPKFGQLLQQFGNEEGSVCITIFSLAYTLTETKYKQAQIRIEQM